jgi:hypothetical protein
MPQELIPADNSELTSWGMKILRKLPFSDEEKESVDMRSLIVDKLRGGGDYGGYQDMITSLSDKGYLEIDEQTSRLTISEKGISELNRADDQRLSRE